jgi:SPX domain protein involved in polyphosphate accumulation
MLIFEWYSSRSAQLFRVRWYGDAKSLEKKEYIFMERKTHHESWVMAKSVKERFPIKPRQLDGFLQGQFKPADIMDQWMQPDSTGIVLIKDETELDKAKQLADEVQEDVLRLHLQPTVRTIYERTAFQVCLKPNLY